MANLKRLLGLGCASAMALSAVISGPVQANNLNAMTWATFSVQHTGTPAQSALWVAMSNSLFASTGLRPTMVGCNGDSPNVCNAYNGDVNENEIRRILCFVPGVSVNPAIPAAPLAEPVQWAQIFAHDPTASGAAVADWRYYFGWSGGRFGLTRLFKAADILSRADGDQKCKDAQTGLNDPNAVMAEHHVSGGGWGAGGLIHANSNVPNQLRYGNQTTVDALNSGYAGHPPRFWVAINGQAANPWD